MPTDELDQWADWVIDTFFGWQFLPATLGAAVVILPFLIAGSIIEIRHYRRLAEGAREEPPVTLLTMPPTHGVALGVVYAAVCLGPPPFGQILAGIRQVIGGAVEYYERLQDRARREALLRLRAEVRRLGGDTLAGVRLVAVRMGPGLVTIQAYGTALKDGGPRDAARAQVLEHLTSPAPRKGWVMVAVVVGGLLAAALGSVANVAVDLLLGDWVQTGRYR